MKSIVIKTTSFLLIFLLLVMINSIVFTNPVFTKKVSAAGLENNDILTGLGIAAILYILFESMDNDELVEPEINRDEFQNDQNIEITIDSINVDLLARAIYAEARGESFEGQIAVGAVIINRMNSSKFPNTVESVLYQPGQFKCVENGQINQVPNQNAYRAARRAVDGVDPSKGALFFFNPDKSENPAAFDRYEVTVRIGDHVFAK